MNMETHFNILRQTRANVIRICEGLTEEQLNIIPTGFKNNIAWNVAHLVVTQQLLVYKLSGVQPLISAEMIDEFRKGTVPTRSISASEFEGYKKQLTDLVDRAESDFKAGQFTSFQPYATSYGIELTSTEEALTFNNAHEALHFGYIMAMRKLV